MLTAIFEDEAKAAYEAYARVSGKPESWEQLDHQTREEWRISALQKWADADKRAN